MPINEIDIESLPSGQIGITLEVQQIGPQGPTGPANTLSIGSVTSGETPSATLTGTAPTQTLNLVLPKGDQGEAGADALWNFRGEVFGTEYIRVTGLTPSFNDVFFNYLSNGRPRYDDPSGFFSIYWDDTEWVLVSPFTSAYWKSNENVASPELVTTWTKYGSGTGTPILTKIEADNFEVGDVVTYGGETWYCNTSYIFDAEAPEYPEVGSPYWELIAAKGDQGNQGPIGETGPVNSLSIGTVTSGETPAATITGSAPNQTLNLVLEKGDKGDQGDAATLTLGTVSTGAAGSNVSITNSGTSSDAVFNFSIPRGDKGETGDVGPIGPVGPEPSLNVTDNAGTSITLADTDNNKVVRCTAATAVTITVPSTLAAGFSCMIIQAGAGQITFVQGSGATLNSFGNLFKTAGQHAPASLIRLGAGIYNLSGNLA